MILLDTDVLIDIQRNHLPAIQWFRGLTEIPSIPGFVLMELIQDAANSQQVKTVLKLVAPLPVIWPTVFDCNRAPFRLHTISFVRSIGLAGCLDRRVRRRLVGQPVHIQHQALPCDSESPHFTAI